MSQPTRVLIADDHPVVREGLAAMLGRRPSLAVVGQAQDGAQAVEMARRLQPNVVLMDLHMPVLDGVEATARIRQDLPQVQVLILTTFDHDSLILAGLRAGARGYVLKDAPAEDIVQAITALARGDAYLQPTVAARVLDQLALDGPAPQKPEGRTWEGLPQADQRQAGGHLAGGPGELAQGGLTLSERERDVLAWLSRGLTSREIGERLSIAESTVKTHLAGLYSKLGVSDRAGAVAEAVRRGLLILR
jgi:DNA-binding NarL/FixJ family response regulator